MPILQKDKNKLFKEDKLIRSVYQINATIIDISEKEIPLDPRAFKGLTITKNFIEDILPILTLNMIIPDKLIDEMKEKKQVNKIKLKIERFDTKEDITGGPIRSKTPPETVLENVFQAFTIEPTPDAMREEKYASSGSKEKDDYKELKQASLTKLYLMPFKSFNINKRTHNGIFTNCTTQNVFGKFANAVKIEKALVKPFETSKVYPQIIVPPFSFRPFIDYIEEDYGIYKYPAIKFFDIDDMFYFMPMEAKKFVKKAGTINEVIVNIGSPLNNFAGRMGYYKDEENQKYMVNTYNDVIMNDHAVINKDLNGGIFKSFTPKDVKYSTDYFDNGKFKFGSGFKTMVPDIARAKDNEKVQFDFNNKETELYKERSEAKRTLSDMIVSFSISETDITYLRPNTKFELIFDQESFAKQLDGNYTPMMYNITFENTGDYKAVKQNTELMLSKEKEEK